MEPLSCTQRLNLKHNMASVIVRSELSRYINIELVALNGLFPVLWLKFADPN